MTPRPRKVTDEAIHAATYRAMQRLGPGELTLAAIAEEAGVTAAALSHRFGSKRELLLSLAQQAAGSAGDFMRALREQSDSPVDTIRSYAECMAQMAASPAALARSLAYLQIDLTDEDFRAPLLAQSKATRTSLVSLITEAQSLGELHKLADARQLAQLLETVVSGSLLTWAMHRKGKASKWVRSQVDAVLEPYLILGR